MTSAVADADASVVACVAAEVTPDALGGGVECGLEFGRPVVEIGLEPVNAPGVIALAT